MIIYLINKETNEVINKYDNVINWGYNFVEYENDIRCKFYCNEENEYFTDIVQNDDINAKFNSEAI